MAEIVPFGGFFHCTSVWQFTVRTLSAEMDPFGRNSPTDIRLMMLRLQLKDFMAVRCGLKTDQNSFSRTLRDQLCQAVGDLETVDRDRVVMAIDV